MNINTSVNGDPSQCHAAARRLHRLATAFDAAGEKLTRHSDLPVDEFGGLSGDAFRRRTATLAGCAASASEDSAGLARAMEELGRRLDDVRLLMHRVRLAARVSLVVDGSVIRQPEPWASSHDQLVFDTVRHVVEGARRLEQHAQLEWQSALSKYTDTAPPIPPPIHLPLPLPIHAGSLDSLLRGDGSAPAPDPGPQPGAPSHAPTPAFELVAEPAGMHAHGAGAVGGTWVAEQVSQWHFEEVVEAPAEAPAATCGTFANADLDSAEAFDDAL